MNNIQTYSAPEPEFLMEAGSQDCDFNPLSLILHKDKPDWNFTYGISNIDRCINLYDLLIQQYMVDFID